MIVVVFYSFLFFFLQIVFFLFYLTQIHFVEVPFFPEGTDTNITVFTIQKQCLINVFWRAFQFLPAQWNRKTKQNEQTKILEENKVDDSEIFDKIVSLY